MPDQKRFLDQKLIAADFYNEVLVKCPQCKAKAAAHADSLSQIAKLVCTECGYNKTATMQNGGGRTNAAANTYFQAELWLQYPFGNDLFWAYNEQHLKYLEEYIAASLRQSLNRSGFTMTEKLPRFIQQGSNRRALLKIIERLKQTL
jgi:Zn ribbon nucleic-acid-binding protein